MFCVHRYCVIPIRSSGANNDVYRISDAETQIGAGLIEEVIQVAEGELKLVDTMVESKVYVVGL